MAIVASSLSQVCKAICTFVGNGLNDGEISVRVTLGNPGDAVPAESEGHRLNLFYFRFEPFQFDADMLPGDTWYLRMHCLITPFAVLENSTSAGENDLRLVGEVLRLFHEKPVFLLTVDGEGFHVQVILQNLGLDQLNQLWSTQGDVAYRPSLLYEVSLAPVIPKSKTVSAPLAGAVGAETRADMGAEAEGLAFAAPEVRPVAVNTRPEDWAPAISFVVSGACLQSASLALGSAELAAFAPRVWIAGLPSAAVKLRWDVWDATTGWQTQTAFTAAVASSPALDPDAAGSAATVAVTLPFTDHAGQAVLYAERTYTRALDGAVLTVRSNPLLVNLYGVEP